MTERSTFTKGPVILIFADDRNNLKLKDQVEQVQSAVRQFPHQLQCLVVLSDATESLDGQTLSEFKAAQIRKDFEVWPDEFLFILLGEDGLVQRKEAFVMKDEDILKALHHE